MKQGRSRRRNAASDPGYPGMPSDDEIFGWVNDLWRLGDQSKYGYRMPGTAADHEAARYIERKFREFGLEDVRREPMNIFTAFPGDWRLKVQAGATAEEMPCCFLPYAAFTPGEGITGELVYVGEASEREFEAKSVAGKIVVVDLIAPDSPRGLGAGAFLYAYDPHGTLATPRGSDGFPIINLPSSIDLARRHGAKGYIGILTFRADDDCQEYHGPKYGNQVISAVTVSPSSGAHLKSLLARGPVCATITLTEENRSDSWHAPAFGSWGVTYNIYGSLPGTGDEVVIVMSHHDGGATNEASGVSAVMALARYFGAPPRRSRSKSLLFFAHGSHFGWRPPLLDSCRPIAAVRDSIACAMNIEMIGRQMDVADGKYVASELIAPTMFGISSGSPHLVSIVRAAIEKHRLERTVIGTWLGGEGIVMSMAGISPVIERISLNATQFSKADTPATVMKEALRATACAFADIIAAIDPLPAGELRTASASSA
jgi:Peptidase family M28